MTEQFVPYEIALKLKELGFDEKCFSMYDDTPNGAFLYQYKKPQKLSLGLGKSDCSAPLYQQAFDWFREKYNLDSEIYLNHDFNCKKIYTYLILQLNGNIISHKCSTTGQYNNHKEAQLKCLEKLIEICKE